MCGLAGLFHPHPDGPVDPALLHAMTDAIAHRGPDGEGHHLEPGIGFGHRRLAIIDLAGGAQPMFNEDRSVVIVFNGEIYNFATLRPELEALGHVFASDHSDTETIIHAWESWGPDCLARLSGMFVFAIWDRKRRQCFLARDRLGKKPLYYAALPDGGLAFGSEMAALAAIPTLKRRIAPQSVADFLTWGYVPDPDTIYAGIHRLPAAHWMLLEHGATPRIRRYWSAPSSVAAMDEPTAIAGITDHLRRATATRLMSDVPLGAFLSGGVDSSAVVAMAAPLSQGRLDSFTIGFDGAEDETPYAALVATRYGTTQHNDHAAAVDMIDAARQQGDIFGEPFGDSSAVPTHRVCALARRHATVALSGDGGDEVFAGYRRYRFHLLVEGIRRHLPAGVRRHAVGALARAWPKLDWAPRPLRFKSTLSELALESALGYLRTMTQVQAEQRAALLNIDLSGYDPTARIAATMQDEAIEDPLLAAQRVDLETWLSGRMLVKVDRASMANSLEVRCPFLDQDLVSWGLALPAALKLRDGQGKYVLKRALEPLLPRDILYRPKQGFAASLSGVLRAQSALVRQRLSGLEACGLFRPDAVDRLVTEHASGRVDHATKLWLLLIFEGFLRSQGVQSNQVQPG
jgi:asparagine synthase (glutamine-hydrolysing)